MTAADTPAHLLRWVGSKRRIMDRVMAQMPQRIESYCAPFGGSLADVFALVASGRLAEGATVVVSDVPVVRDLYRAVYDRVDLLDDELRGYGVRNFEPQDEFDAHAASAYEDAKFALRTTNVDAAMGRRRAAALLVLNQLAFNGLYRVNRKGEYNVPRDPGKTLDVDAIIARVDACHAALKRVSLVIANDWTQALLADAHVYYADPPYHGTFNAYSAQPFTFGDQSALARTLAFIRADRASVVIASNADTPEVRDWYPSRYWRHAHLSRANNITCDAATRGNAVTELLMVAR